MTVHRMGESDVTVYLAAADGDLGLFLGAFARITVAGRPTALWREAGDDWRRTQDTLETLRDRDYLVHEADLHDLDDVEPDRFPGLRRLLEQLELARAIAAGAHAGQRDKNGDSYIEHPARVAARVSTLRGQAAAWLHDVVEDTATTAQDLRDKGVDAAVVEAVLLLTRPAGGAEDDYYRRIAEHPIAREVKLADIADNTDPARTARLDPEVRDRLAKKYEHARRALGALEEQP